MKDIDKDIYINNVFRKMKKMLNWNCLMVYCVDMFEVLFGFNFFFVFLKKLIVDWFKNCVNVNNRN